MEEVNKLNRFLKVALGLVNQLDNEDVDDRKIVNSFRNELEKLREELKDPELKEYIEWLNNEKSYEFWEEEFLTPRGTKEIVPIIWRSWDLSTKKLVKYPTRKIIKNTLQWRSWNLAGKFLEKAQDSNDILGQELLDLKNGLSLDCNLDDVVEIVGNENFKPKIKETLEVVNREKEKLKAISLSLEEVLKIASRKVYDLNTRKELSDWAYLMPAYLSPLIAHFRANFIEQLFQIEEDIEKINEIRQNIGKSSNPYINFLKNEIEAHKQLFRLNFFKLINYVNRELEEKQPRGEWYEEREVPVGKVEVVEEVKPPRKEKIPTIAEQKMELSESLILEILKEGPLTAMEIKEKLTNLKCEFNEDSFSNLITSMSREGKIELTYGPTGIRWKIRES